jgi:hypothetical protein
MRLPAIGRYLVFMYGIPLHAESQARSRIASAPNETKDFTRPLKGICRCILEGVLRQAMSVRLVSSAPRAGAWRDLNIDARAVTA